MKTNKEFQDMVNNLGEAYLKKVINTLNKLLKENDLKKIYAESHKLKGSGQTYGFKKISVAAEEIESLSKELLAKKKTYLQKNKSLISQKIEKLKNLVTTYQDFSIK